MDKFIKNLKAAVTEPVKDYFIAVYDAAERHAMAEAKLQNREHSADDIDKYLLSKEVKSEVKRLNIEQLLALYHVVEDWSVYDHINQYKFAAVQQCMMIAIQSSMENEINKLNHSKNQYCKKHPILSEQGNKVLVVFENIIQNEELNIVEKTEKLVQMLTPKGQDKDFKTLPPKVYHEIQKFLNHMRKVAGIIYTSVASTIAQAKQSLLQAMGHLDESNTQQVIESKKP